MHGLERARFPIPEPQGRTSRRRVSLGIKERVRGRILGAAALVGAAIVALLGPESTASAEPFSLLPATTEALRSSGPAGPTAAWVTFCGQLPDECVVDVAEPARLALSPDLWNAIVQVNERVNDMIRPVTDHDHWGVIDRWDYPDDGMGDCEDIQLLKRRLLMEAGLPLRTMRMAVVLDELGSGHAVMMVLTDRGDFILDNKRNAVLPWRQTGYVYLKREGTVSADWVALHDPAAPIVTANR
jgi:predicted transglutaminase-like cysteine proteinase